MGTIEESRSSQFMTKQIHLFLMDCCIDSDIFELAITWRKEYEEFMLLKYQGVENIGIWLSLPFVI